MAENTDPEFINDQVRLARDLAYQSIQSFVRKIKVPIGQAQHPSHAITLAQLKRMRGK